MAEQVETPATVSEFPSKWLIFEELPSSGAYRTGRWLVRTKVARNRLGEVRWSVCWRQYAFFPDPGTIFAASCFTDIARFIRQRKG